MQKAGQSLTEIKTQISSKIISNEEIIKALIIPDEDFLDIIPTLEQQLILDEPDVLIRQQIMLTRNVTSKTNKDMPYITSAYVNFQKESLTYQSGIVYFYIIIPNRLEKTSYGIRYDFIGDKLDEIFSSVGNSIGRFEFYERSDIPIDQDCMGHFISFKMLDFRSW